MSSRPQPAIEPETAEPDSIDPGMRLIRVGGESGLSLAERFAERMRRIAWRTPLHGLRLNGRSPLKLLCVPDDPILGDIARGHALLEGRLSFLGETHDFTQIDLNKPDWSARFGEHLHSFNWLRDLSSVATRVQGMPIAEALMGRWLAANADTVAEPAWRGDLWGRRILMWSAHAPLILSSTDLVYRSKVLNTLARGARHLERGSDKLPAGAPRLAALVGQVAASMLLPDGEPIRPGLEARLARGIDASIAPDGGIVSRLPAAQLEAVELLALLAQIYDARRIEPPVFLDETLARLVPSLLGLCLGDRGSSSWQGAGPLGAERIGDVIAASGVRTRPLRQSRDWGYQRLAAGPAVLVVDAAPPPIGRLADGGCASTLAFEFSDGAQRLVVNCGGARAALFQVPAGLAEGLRTTAAHSTLVLGDSNSTAIHADGTLGRGVAEVELSRQENDAASRLEASHDGYVRRFGLKHQRQLLLTGDGKELRGEDRLLPAGRRRKLPQVQFAIRFHLGFGVDVSPTADGAGALLRLPNGGLWQFRCKGGALAVEESLWIDAAGRPHPTRQLVLSDAALPGGVSVSWLLKRAG